MAVKTLYLMKDGTYADPSECSEGKDGVLRHKNGMEVAMRDDPRVPMSRSVDDEEPKQVPETIKVPAAKVAEAESKDAEAEKPKRAYTRRDMTAKD